MGIAPDKELKEIEESGDSAMRFLRSSYPSAVAAGGNIQPDVEVGFHGKLSAAGLNRALSFKAALFYDLGINSLITSVRRGCFEVGLKLDSNVDGYRLFRAVDLGEFDGLAFQYQVLSVHFRFDESLDDFRFQRDSVYR